MFIAISTGHVCYCLVIDRNCIVPWFQSTGNKGSSINIDRPSVLSNLFDRLEPGLSVSFYLLTYFCVLQVTAT